MFIRYESSKSCKKIIGLDVNALYLWAIDQQMPVGPFIRRRAENGFRPELRYRYMTAYHWMDWVNHTGQAAISHRLNYGVGKRVGKYPVDTIYQLQGCYYHGHTCDVTRNVQDKKWRHECETKFEKIKETTTYLKSQGYAVLDM